jgi:hypothetical protein
VDSCGIIEEDGTMKGTIRLDHFEKNIYISNPFANAAKKISSEEYKTLRKVMEDHPDYSIVKYEIKKNPNKESYCGLTYEYMDNYIASHDETGEIKKIYAELRLRAECHSIRYAHIKRWFLQTFPEINDFSGKKEQENELIAA